MRSTPTLLTGKRYRGFDSTVTSTSIVGSTCSTDRCTRPHTWIEVLSYVVAAAVVVASTIRDRLESDPDPVEQLKAQYASGEIDEQTFEREITFHIDDRNERIRSVVENINGVGEVTSKAIAREFDSSEELRSADQDELEDVHGVEKVPPRPFSSACDKGYSGNVECCVRN